MEGQRKGEGTGICIVHTTYCNVSLLMYEIPFNEVEVMVKRQHPNSK